MDYIISWIAYGCLCFQSVLLDSVLVHPLQFITRRQSRQLNGADQTTFRKVTWTMDIQNQANIIWKLGQDQELLSSFCGKQMSNAIEWWMSRWDSYIWSRWKTIISLFNQVCKGRPALALFGSKDGFTATHKCQTQNEWWMCWSCWKIIKPIFHSGMWRTGSTCIAWVKRWRTSSSQLQTPTSFSTTSRTVIRSSFDSFFFGESQMDYFLFWLLKTNLKECTGNGFCETLAVQHAFSILRFWD